MPFANPEGFASEEKFFPLNDPKEVLIEWDENSKGMVQISISLRGKKHALLSPGSKPGWCRLAINPSPIANPLNSIA